jgi:hypothetical protein
MPGASSAPAASRAKNRKHTSKSPRGTGNTRHSLRNGFNGFLRALPSDRLSCRCRRAKLVSLNLMPASRHQDHTTSPSASHAPVLRERNVHRILPHVRDDRETPLWGRDKIADSAASTAASRGISENRKSNDRPKSGTSNARPGVRCRAQTKPRNYRGSMSAFDASRALFAENHAEACTSRQHRHTQSRPDHSREPE